MVQLEALASLDLGEIVFTSKGIMEAIQTKQPSAHSLTFTILTHRKALIRNEYYIHTELILL